MKKILSVILTLLVILLSLPLSVVTASAATSGTTGSCTWSLNDTTLTISGNGAMKDYSSGSTLPWGRGITKVIIEDGVTQVGNYAFYNCSSLRSVTIPDSVTSIGNGAFLYCDSLTEVNITDIAAWCNIDFEGYSANPLNCAEKLYLNDELVTNLVIPDTVTSIGSSAFRDCTSLTSVTIPDSVTSIGSYAFYNTAWYNNQPDGLIYAGKVAYKYKGTCPAKVIIKDGTLGIADSAFSGCTSLTSVNIPDSVTSIGESAFEDCTSLTSVNIPDSVTSIGEYAFRYCDSLTSVTIGSSVTSIGEEAFYECTSLTSVTIPDGVTSIGEDAFYNCSSLTSVTIPDSVTSIRDDAFKNCISLTSVTIGSSVTSIGNSAFYYCKSLTSVTIPDSVTSIGSRAFSSCNSLTSIEVSAKNQNYSSIDGILFNKAKTELICYLAGKTNEDYTIPAGVTSIGDYAFYYCSSLTSVTIGDSVTSIGDWAFCACSSLTSVTIGDSVTSIGDDAFHDCTSLTSVTIPDSVTSIGSYAFLDCDSLKTVYYRGRQTDRKNITIGSLNSDLTGATWYYNSCIGSTEHSYTLNGNNSCNICKYSKAPDAPKTAQITPSSVTLEKVEGLEYSIDGVNWQESNVFLNLKLGTNYTFYQRVKASEISKVSEKSIGLNVTLKYTNTIIPSVPLLETKTDKTVTLNDIEGYEYSNNGTSWQSSNVFNNLSPNTEYTFYQRIAETVDTYASEKSEGLTVTTLKTTNTVIPNIPNLVLKTDTSVTLQALNGYEYSIDGINWQNENFFENLTPATNYTFYQRIAETNTVYASEKSEGLTILTYSYPQTPSAPLFETKTDKTVTLVKMEGYEYSKNGTTWQSSNVFNNLSPNTEYTFYQRIAETNDTYASEKSEGLTVKTYIENTNVPSKPIMLMFDDTSVTLKKANGMEYSIDGENWQEGNVFNGLLPNTEYSFYQRYAQNGDIYHSATSLVLYVTTDRSLQTEIPSAPTVESVTSDKIILNKVDGCEYSINGTTWQSSNIFSNLNCGTEYTFYQRYAKNDSYYEGEKSAALKATTDKGIPNVPKAPTLESKSHNRVTLRLISGYEYSMDGETWQKSNVFTGLNAFTNYAFFCRVAETEKNYASDCSDSLIVKTDAMPEFILGDCNGDYNVDTTDLASLKLFLAAISDLSDTGKLGADLNGDGNVDTTDLAVLKLKLAGIE